MDFRAFLREAADLSTDLAMDPTQGSPQNDQRQGPAPDPSTDGMDPATPGGPAPFNGAPPFGQPVVSDPMLNSGDPATQGRMPYEGPGPDVDTTTLQSRGSLPDTVLNSRTATYENKNRRFR